MPITYADALSAHQITIPPHLIADAEVPVLDTLQAQGDLIIIPRRPGQTARTTIDVPREGVQVVAGEASGNTHWLDNGNPDAPPCQWTTLDGQTLGIVTIPDGQTGHLTHTDEHGCNGIAPGTYEIRRQREMADVERMVQD